MLRSEKYVDGQHFPLESSVSSLLEPHKHEWTTWKDFIFDV